MKSEGIDERTQRESKESMGTQQSDGEHYTPEQVRAILERALSGRSASGSDDPTAIGYEELIETANELDISEQELARAIEEHETHYAIEESEERWKLRRKEKFFEHFRSYLVVNGALMLIDLVTSGGTWFFWPLFGWGIGLGFDAAAAFFPKKRDIERGGRKLLRKERKQAARIAREKQALHRLQGRGRRSGRSSSGGSDGPGKKSIIVDAKRKKLIIESGERRIEIG